jgi:tetratricopeptide (TPR) repeat protein
MCITYLCAIISLIIIPSFRLFSLRHKLCITEIVSQIPRDLSSISIKACRLVLEKEPNNEDAMLSYIFQSTDLEENLALIKGWIAKNISFPRYELKWNNFSIFTYNLLNRMYEIQGCFHMFLKNYEEALKAFDKSMKVDPSKYGLYYERAVAHRMLGNSKASIDDYQTFLQLAEKGL